MEFNYKLLGKLLVVVFIIIVIATQPEKSNPESLPNESVLNSTLTMPDTVKSLLKAACFDCHSNETNWPWYTYVPISSHFTRNHVNEGRKHLNFSKWGSYKQNRKFKKLVEIKEFVDEAEMPLKSYIWLHAEANLITEQRKLIINWTISEVDSMSKLDK